MDRSQFVTLMLIVAVGVAAVMLIRSGETGPSPGFAAAHEGSASRDGAVSADRVSHTGVRRSVDVAEPEPERPREAAPRAPAVRLQVRVTWADGAAPIAGLPLRVAWSDAAADQRTGTTDATGICNVSLPGTVEEFTVRAEGTERIPSFERRSRLTEAAGRYTELVIRLPRSGVIAGRIADASGRAAAGARVRLDAEGRLGGGFRADQQAATRTDGAGRFRFGGVVGDFELEVVADGYPALTAVGRLEPGTSITDAEIQLPAARTVAVLVQTSGEVPVEDAEIQAWRWRDAAPAQDGSPAVRTRRFHAGGTTDAGGRLELNVERDESWELEVRHPAHTPERTAIHPGQDRVVVGLGSPFDISGVVTGSAGTPVPGASLRLWVPVRGQPPSILDFERHREATAADDGTFRFTVGARTSRGCLLARAPGHAVHVTTPLNLAPGAPRLEIELPEARALAGVVVDRSGVPAGGLCVSVRGDRFVHQSARPTDRPQREHLQTTRFASWEAMAELDVTRTDEDGRFRFDSLYDGQFDVVVRGRRKHESLAWVTARSGNRELRVVLGDGLGRLVTLQGRVVEARTGAPVPAFRVGFHRERDDDEPLRVGRDLVHPDGRFALTGIEPGELAVTVKAQGYATWVRDFEHITAGSVELDVELWQRRELEIEVVDAEERPAPGVTVHARDQDDDRLPAGGPGCHNPESRGRPAKTDARGRALLRNLPATQVVLVLETGTRAEPVRLPLDLTRPRDGVERLVLPAD